METRLFFIKPEQFALFINTLSIANITVPHGNIGLINDTKHKILLNLDYDGKELLSLTIVDKPWWLDSESLWIIYEVALDFRESPEPGTFPA